jgi:hypothetical protein
MHILWVRFIGIRYVRSDYMRLILRWLRVFDAKLLVLFVPFRELNNLNQYHTLDNAGDKICIFGFSRGAYTARALAGM